MVTVLTTFAPCFCTSGCAATASGDGSKPGFRPKENICETSACSKMCLKSKPPTVSVGKVPTSAHVSLIIAISAGPKSGIVLVGDGVYVVLADCR